MFESLESFMIGEEEKYKPPSVRDNMADESDASCMEEGGNGTRELQIDSSNEYC